MLSSPVHRRAWALLLPVLALLAVTLPHLKQGDFRTDTGRYAAVGLQAWRDASCFWTPHLQPTVPYFNKPPLVFWIHGFVLHAAGVSLPAARLPSVAAAALCVLLTGSLARRLLGRTTALVSGLVLALTYEFFRRTREISLDLWQLAFMLACVLLVVEGTRRRHSAWLFALAGLPLGLALLCKPLMALLALPLLAVWLAVTGRAARGLPLLGTLAVALAVAAPWHVAMAVQHGTAFTTAYFGNEVAARTLGRGRTEPPWYYAVEMGQTYWPWLLALGTGVMIAVTRASSRRHRDGLLLAGLWAIGWFVALSVFPDKHPRYELPLYPALALLAGHGLVRLPWGSLRRCYRRALPAAGAVVVAAGLLAAVLPLRVQAPPDSNWASVLDWLRTRSNARVFAGALSTNDEGSYYLKTGRWPKPFNGRLRDLPDDGVLLYTDGLMPHAGSDETVLFRAGPYQITQRRRTPESGR